MVSTLTTSQLVKYIKGPSDTFVQVRERVGLLFLLLPPHSTITTTTCCFQRIQSHFSDVIRQNSHTHSSLFLTHPLNPTFCASSLYACVCLRLYTSTIWSSYCWNPPLVRKRPAIWLEIRFATRCLTLRPKRLRSRAQGPARHFNLPTPYPQEPPKYLGDQGQMHRRPPQMRWRVRKTCRFLSAYLLLLLLPRGDLGKRLADLIMTRPLPARLKPPRRYVCAHHKPAR